MSHLGPARQRKSRRLAPGSALAASADPSWRPFPRYPCYARREAIVPEEEIELLREAEPDSARDAPVRDAPAFIDRFRREVLPPKYRPVFEKGACDTP
ncbi:MAG TPA: hypothetical protein VM925_28730 [Labilithrix sp.]|nr:hypothetical protein [Labilithrix sp.]